MGAEDARHLGDMVVFTVSIIVAWLQAELPLAGTDGGRARAVTAQGRGHREGLHSGLSPESSFTYRERRERWWSLQEGGSTPFPGPSSAPCKTTPSGKFLANVLGGLPFSELGLRPRWLPSMRHFTSTWFSSTNAL